MLIKEKSEIKFVIIRDTISNDDNMLNISWMCLFAGVSRSGYYRWIGAEETRKVAEEKDKQDFDLILIAYTFRGFAKGARGIYMRLIHQRPPTIMNLKKIRRLMKKYALKCPIRNANPHRRMARALKTSLIAPNLVNREFRDHGPRTILLTDITYIRRMDGKFSYLATILDAFTLQVLSYALSDSLEVDFILEMIQLLIKNHGVSLHAETIIHSDQGCHYTSYKFIDIVKSSSLRQSMSRKANCWDNAPQESFFGHMKDDIEITNCYTHEQIVVAINEWMDYYNNDRYHWDLAKLSPNEYYDYIKTGIYPLPVSPPRET
ncbi:MAG: IS3 family transposase [Bacillota bacterium]